MYQARINIEKRRNPCLSDLHEYLCQPGAARDRSRIVSLDFHASSDAPLVREIPVRGLQDELQRTADPDKLGQLLVIEDISKQTIEELGSLFDIDPWFFASYIHQAWRKTGTQSPSSGSLPSRQRKQNFLSLPYHRTVSFAKEDVQLSTLERNCNHRRKVVILPAFGKQRIGLAQHCCSVTLVKRAGSSWIGILLVDPAMNGDYVAPPWRHNSVPPIVHSEPFLGGCEDFTSNPDYESKDRSPSNRGMLDELVYYWSRNSSPLFDADDPTLESVAYYPLRIVAAEWINYVSVMGFCIREYELSTNPSGNLLAELESLNKNLHTLQAWRRRVMSTQTKLRSTMRFIRNHDHSNPPYEDWKAVLEDYEYLNVEVTEHGARLEAMVPLVTSAVALIESRRSLTETANVTRLTILAVVFLPLSYIASLFSMSDTFRPGGPLFWVYFVVAIPLTLVIGLVAKPPVQVLNRLARKLKVLR